MPIKHRLDLGTQLPRGWRSAAGLPWKCTFGSTLHLNLRHTVCARETEGNRLGDSPERLSDLLTFTQSCRGGAGSSLLWLSIPRCSCHRLQP